MELTVKSLTLEENTIRLSVAVYETNPPCQPPIPDSLLNDCPYEVKASKVLRAACCFT